MATLVLICMRYGYYYPKNLPQLFAQEPSRMRGFALSHLLGSATSDKLSATVAPLRTDVDDIIGTLDNLHVMFDDNDGMSTGDERIKRLHQTLDIVEVQSRSGLIEDKHRRLCLLKAEVIGQFHTLVLTAREGR